MLRLNLHRARALSVLTILLLGAAACRTTPRASAPRPDSEKPVFLWIEVGSNLERIGSTERLTAVLDRAAEMGFTGIVLEVKQYSGHTIYPSEVAPVIERWPMHNDPNQMWVRDPGFDRVAEACRLGHERGLQVLAGINAFCEGDRTLAVDNSAERGMVYDGHPDWAVWDYVILDGEPQLISAAEDPIDTHVFVSPHRRDVVEHELAVIREVVTRYPVDGVILDRVRFNGSRSDFSPAAREAFEAYLGHPVEHWPEDVYRRTGMEWMQLEPGPLWNDWLIFRAQTIHEFIVEARETVKSVRPDCIFGDYVGAWYPIYYDVGVNWASPRYVPEWPEFPPGWESTGYADQLDLLMVGNYYLAVTPEDISGERADGLTGDWLSVQGSAQLAMEAVDGECPVLGSLYTGQYGYDSPTGEYMLDRYERALRSACGNTDGLMIFDLVHFDEFDLWDTVGTFLRELRASPSQAPGR